MRSGIIAGTGALGLPSTSSISGKGSRNTILKLRSSTASIPVTAAISILPSASPRAQRLSEATQSEALTGAPSCQTRPSRSLNCQLRPSDAVENVSTIWGRIVPAMSIENSVSKT